MIKTPHFVRSSYDQMFKKVSESVLKDSSTFFKVSPLFKWPVGKQARMLSNLQVNVTVTKREHVNLTQNYIKKVKTDLIFSRIHLSGLLVVGGEGDGSSSEIWWPTTCKGWIH